MQRNATERPDRRSFLLDVFMEAGPATTAPTLEHAKIRRARVASSLPGNSQDGAPPALVAWRATPRARSQRTCTKGPRNGLARRASGSWHVSCSDEGSRDAPPVDPPAHLVDPARGILKCENSFPDSFLHRH